MMPEGTIESDGFPGFYKRRNCTYAIQGQLGSEIVLIIQKMDVGKKENGNCTSDYLEVIFLLAPLHKNIFNEKISSMAFLSNGRIEWFVGK